MSGQQMQDLRQLRGRRVLRAQSRLFDGPGDGEGGIAPQDDDLIFPVVELGALVSHVGRLGEDAEAVGEPRRHVELPQVLSGENFSYPLAESGGVRADVHGHVEDLALDGAHELSLGLAELGVEAAQRAADGEGVVVLEEVLGQAAVAELALVIGLQEEAALVAEDGRLDQGHAGYGGGKKFHASAPTVSPLPGSTPGSTPSPSRSRPYVPVCTDSHQGRFSRYQRTVARRPASKSWRGAQPSSPRALASSMA